MSRARTAVVSSRINIPISPGVRTLMEQTATEENITMAELGRRAIERYLAEEQRRRRMEQLCRTARKFSSLIEETAREWRVTELDDWQDA